MSTVGNTEQEFDCELQGFKLLKGLKINNKYLVGSCIGKGCYGSVFKVQGSKHAIKIQLDTDMMAFEVKALKAMEKSRKSKGVTKIVDYGILILKNFG